MRSIWHSPGFTIPYLMLLAAGLAFVYVYPYGYELTLFNVWRQEYGFVFQWLTKMGEVALWIVAAIIIAFYRYRYTLVMALAGIILIVTSNLVKHYAGVPRPNTFLDKYDLQSWVTKVPGEVLNGGYTSMPSGHTMTAFAMFSLMVLFFGKRNPWVAPLALTGAVLVAVSRMFLVQHFLSDVLMGSMFGLLISDLAWQLDKKVR